MSIINNAPKTSVGQAFANLMNDEPDAVFSPGENLTVLKGNDNLKSQGSWVFSDQGVAADNGFKNVSKYWYEKTMSFEKGFELLAEDKSKTHDIMATIAEVEPAVVDGKFVIKYKDGRSFRPTPHAIEQMGGWAGTGSWYVKSLLDAPTDAKERPKFARDEKDAETLVTVIKNGFRRLKQDKPFLFRTREDGTMRAMLSDIYAKVDNEWFLKSLQQIVPGARLSHWKGDGDTIFGNLLIPDTIREEKDSEYGGMLSIGNSEIGTRRIETCPSIFRAICMNGCIWGQEQGKAIKQVHRGKIDLEKLFAVIKTNLELQIPLLPVGIDMLMKTRELKWSGDSMRPLFAQVANEFSMSKAEATSLLGAYNVERAGTPEYSRTLFSVVNAITRAGQTFSPQTWVKFDEIGGKLMSFDKSGWEHLTNSAKRLKEKEVEEAFNVAA